MSRHVGSGGVARVPVRYTAGLMFTQSSRIRSEQGWYLHEQARGLWEGGHGAGQVHGLLPGSLPPSGHEEQAVPGQGGLHGISPPGWC